MIGHFTNYLDRTFADVWSPTRLPTTVTRREIFAAMQKGRLGKASTFRSSAFTRLTPRGR